MMYASAPAHFVPRFTYKNKFDQPRYADGSAKVMPYGLRVAEEILLRNYKADDAVVCCPDDLDTFVGLTTRSAPPFRAAFTRTFLGRRPARSTPLNRSESTFTPHSFVTSRRS